MTMHESLKFLDALRAHLEKNASEPGPWCWPTRDVVNRTLLLNRKAFPRDAKPGDSFKRQLGIALRQHWIAAGGCQPGCHAQHLSLTAAGQEALKLMNEQGCPLCRDHADRTLRGIPKGCAPRLHFERRVA
jgi:hypothetical protein